MERDELAAWLRLTLTPGIGNGRARKLLAAFGLPQAIFEQSDTGLRQVVTPAQAQALRSPPAELANLVDHTWQWLQSSQPGHPARRLATLGDAHYPPALLNLDDPPLLLYLLGNAVFGNAGDGTADPADLRIDPARSLAVVGRPHPTPPGAAHARLFSRALAQAGLTVVSGLALGIDAAAHEGALDAIDDQTSHGATVAVVGTGLDRVYPKAHRDLAHRIARHGLLVSEYPLGTPPLTANFPKRNRLIAGLAQGTLVVEAALKSGSLISARLSAEQGKEVFAVPGSIHAAQSRGCHALIKQGAKLVESAQDVLEELKWPLTQPGLPPAAAAQTPAADTADGLLTALGFDPVGLDALQARTGWPTADLQAQLMTLEIDGHIARLPGGLFQRQA